MIRWSGISLSWLCSVCFTVVIATAGCNNTPQDAAPTHARTPIAAEPRNGAPGESAAEVAESEMDPSGEDVGVEGASTGEQPPMETPPKPAVPTPGPNEPKAAKVALSVPEPPPYIFDPQVLMSQQDADSCLVKVGEPFPVGELSDLEGQQRSLKELFGEKLTVIVFWANENRLGREQIQRLEAETVVPFANTGLSVIAINISDPPDQIGDLLPADSTTGFTMLLDTDAALYSKVATRRHPRTYLLDATGNVLWFDIEYSRSTARELANAIHVYLSERKTGES